MLCFYYERLWDLCIKFGITDLTLPSIKGHLQTSYIINENPNKIDVIYYGVGSEFMPNKEKSKRELRQSLGLPNDRKLILITGQSLVMILLGITPLGLIVKYFLSILMLTFENVCILNFFLTKITFCFLHSTKNFFNFIIILNITYIKFFQRAIFNKINVRFTNYYHIDKLILKFLIVLFQ